MAGGYVADPLPPLSFGDPLTHPREACTNPHSRRQLHAKCRAGRCEKGGVTQIRGGGYAGYPPPLKIFFVGTPPAKGRGGYQRFDVGITENGRGFPTAFVRSPLPASQSLHRIMQIYL